ncbi:hypothetical protein LguiB_012949 [Lonicera macranthoides]
MPSPYSKHSPPASPTPRPKIRLAQTSATIRCFGEETTICENGEMAYNLLLEYGSGETLADLIKKSNGKGLPESKGFRSLRGGERRRWKGFERPNAHPAVCWNCDGNFLIRQQNEVEIAKASIEKENNHEGKLPPPFPAILAQTSNPPLLKAEEVS